MQPQFEQLYFQYHSRVYGITLRFLGNPTEAEDMTQETFARAWKHFADYDPKRSFAAWLTCIAINLCRDRLRRRKCHREVSLEFISSLGNTLEERHEFADSTWDPLHLLLNEATHESMLDAINTLSPSLRTTFLLMAQNLSYTEIGQRINSPTGTVRSRIYRARMQLRRLLECDWASDFD